MASFKVSSSSEFVSVTTVMMLLLAVIINIYPAPVAASASVEQVAKEQGTTEVAVHHHEIQGRVLLGFGALGKFVGGLGKTTSEIGNDVRNIGNRGTNGNYFGTNGNRGTNGNYFGNNGNRGTNGNYFGTNGNYNGNRGTNGNYNGNRGTNGNYFGTNGNYNGNRGTNGNRGNSGGNGRGKGDKNTPDNPFDNFAVPPSDGSTPSLPEYYQYLDKTYCHHCEPATDPNGSFYCGFVFKSTPDSNKNLCEGCAALAHCCQGKNGVCNKCCPGKDGSREYVY